MYEQAHPMQASLQMGYKVPPVVHCKKAEPHKKFFKAVWQAPAE